MMKLAVGEVVGNYRITRFLGRGGFSLVYQGEHVETGETVALKFGNNAGGGRYVTRLMEVTSKRTPEGISPDETPGEAIFFQPGGVRIDFLDVEEIDRLLADAVAGRIPPERLEAPAHKVFKGEGNRVEPVQGNLGAIVARLAGVNCELWHEQEKVYEFEKVPPREKDGVVRRLAVLNLERNECIDAIDREFARAVRKGSVEVQ